MVFWFKELSFGAKSIFWCKECWFKEFIDHRDPHLLGPPLRPDPQSYSALSVLCAGVSARRHPCNGYLGRSQKKETRRKKKSERALALGLSA